MQRPALALLDLKVAVLFAIACFSMVAAALGEAPTTATEPAARKPADDVSKDYAVRLTAEVRREPPGITVHWVPIPGATGYLVKKSLKDAFVWTEPRELGADQLSFLDEGVAPGVVYQYFVEAKMPAEAKATTLPSGPKPRRRLGNARIGFIQSGIDVPLVDSRGKLILLVDAAEAGALAMEVARLEQDLVGDGWEVIRHDVAFSEPPPALREWIQGEYRRDPDHVKAVFMVGHLPWVRSGYYAPDGHADRVGAQPADVYYADMDGVYTDESGPPVIPGATQPAPGATQPALKVRDECVNVPHDGRFDQSRIPGKTILQLGRVDFVDLPAFAPRTPTDLLRQYLDKDHRFRHKMFTLPERCVYADHFHVMDGQTFAASAWRSCVPMFGIDRIDLHAGDWLKELNQNGSIWAYADGWGSYTNCSNILTTKELGAGSDPKAVFFMLLGSYFVDWQSRDNLQRALLSTPGYSLTVAWSGIPQLDFHAMAMGETAGYCVRFSQRIDTTVFALPATVHICLLGDPTLRLHVVSPASELRATRGRDGVELAWTESNQRDVLGYHVYRSPSKTGPFTRITSEPVKGGAYVDAGSPPGESTYMVRAVVLQKSASGSYFNASQGVFATAAPVLR